MNKKKVLNKLLKAQKSMIAAERSLGEAYTEFNMVEIGKLKLDIGIALDKLKLIGLVL